ncbi:MAG: hypothetical protein HOI34_00125 [Rhodospirillaceae bacterium]|jgi:hypothetical protein|nr:hypothetical protein [Rhodospirillaceae bacterium]MBT6512275.1 hypothetical protein [Rhodospirillaceae bacterium]MBT7613087.1 hypothetical protein [Rhodospirillaceae bacterium]MBT7646514.1 hypothetical protein [Rhodospirillaceae bacterium]
MQITTKQFAGILAGLAFIAAAGAAHAQQTRTYTGFAALDSEGLIVVTSEDSFRTLSTMTGDLFLDDGNGLVDTADVMCTSSLENNAATSVMEGSGECVITEPDGAQMYAIWTCVGTVFIGCDGDFQIVSGNDRYEGVTGGGLMSVRTMETDIAPEDATAGAEISGKGFVIWDEFVLTMP